jgi:predicted ABC-class ATPase
MHRLESILSRIDGRGYRAYKDLTGTYEFEGMTLFIDHVQGDPFAAPSKLRLRAPLSVSGIPSSLFEGRLRRISLEDYLGRQVQFLLKSRNRPYQGSGKSGLIQIDAGGQEILERSSVRLNQNWVELRLEVGLPAAGRKILGCEAKKLLLDTLPDLSNRGLHFENVDPDKARAFIDCAENQEFIRSWLQECGLVAFVANQSILARRSGASDLPLHENSIPFLSPKSMERSLDLPHPRIPDKPETTRITGMGIPKGICLIVGGGYHGKSTLLKALERGIYPHIPGDGREYVVTCPKAVKIRSEDGRRVEKVDVSPFINNLPQGRNTELFCSDDASGSTSQAASIMEALEIGSDLLLMDEDSSATNFMIRDRRMQELVAREHEPITPYIDRVQEIYERFSVSTILVMGGCGDYLDKANPIIMLKEFLPQDCTEEAHTLAKQIETDRITETLKPMSIGISRVPDAESISAARGRNEVKIDLKGLDEILFGQTPLNLRALEQIVDRSQCRAIGFAIRLVQHKFMATDRSLRDSLKLLDLYMDENGIDVLDPYYQPERHPGHFARPRIIEIAAAVNRLRTLKIV